MLIGFVVGVNSMVTQDKFTAYFDSLGVTWHRTPRHTRANEADRGAPPAARLSVWAPMASDIT